MTIRCRIKDEFSFIKGNILVNTVTIAVILVTAAIPYTFYPKYIEGLGGNAFIVGIIGFAAYVTLALVQIPGGYLADKYGRRKLIVTMTFATSITYFLFAIAPNWQFFLLATILQNTFMIYQPALQALVADSTPPEKRGMGFSIINLLHHISIPSPIIAGILVVQFGIISGMQIGYLIVSIAFIVTAIIRTKFKETLKTTFEGNPIKDAIKNIPNSIIESTKALKTESNPMLFLFGSFAIYHFAWYMCSIYLVVYATEILNIPELNWAILMTWFSIVNVVTALPCGKIVDKIGRKKPLIVAWVLFIPGLVGFVYGNPIIIAISLLCFGVALILANSAYPALIADFVVREKRGKIIGSTNFFFNILSGLGQLSGGVMYEYVSPELPFLTSAILFIPCLILTLFKVKEPTKREL
ncbi:MAG: MFS transporter [Candidatus Bathyarchaeota archaeon]|nr:MFS transporter [Candidatus Bathyarchaeum tardum]WGM90287.1 MAG: MFS transporter [Candidatus Bathyarchaeum tardum]